MEALTFEKFVQCCTLSCCINRIGEPRDDNHFYNAASIISTIHIAQAQATGIHHAHLSPLPTTQTKTNQQQPQHLTPSSYVPNQSTLHPSDPSISLADG